ncbi:protein ACCELERATED CELL DEATH 6-like isoform X2 [Camellia sinensis]|uniref:protein ACCELERATED CELL DEATH 6-like isoform X2 n=1 Tax=Camellia sinensis TaxID=4442 RepID=UPI001036B31D|nr:protein ACCELERATED CELL DEATH 6-like isoform X2 [Camellia sinensis]
MAATIPIFDGDNYQFWKVKMKTLFLSMDLWDTVEKGYDGETDRNGEKQRKDAAALSLIQQGVSDWIFPKIKEAKKAKEAWDTLQDPFERQTRYSCSRLRSIVSLGRLPVPANISKSKETILIVASLIATVTFTAGITMPGGYINDNKDPNQGMAILTRKAAFVAFVITDTIALTLSVCAVFGYLSTMLYDDPIVLKKQLTLACSNTCNAMIAMLLAFITGAYAVLAPSRLSISVCVIPCILVLYNEFYDGFLLPVLRTEDV